MHKCVSHLRRETGAKQVRQAGVITTSSCVQHCLCEEPTQKRVDALHEVFNQVCEQNRNVLTWAGLYRQWTTGGAEASEQSPSSFTPQLSLQYLLETAFKEQYQARFTALLNLNTLITMQLETLGRFTVIFI